MKKLTTNEIRKIWLDFWIEKNHFLLEPKSLIPYNDDSLLFINSGVATLKDYLSGTSKPPSKRLVNSQKSLRTNDIENVGVTSRHHTLFEMLGNFSIGDYFKKEAIEYAWELLTSTKYYDFDENKLYITIHPDDHDSHDFWLKVGVPNDKIIKTEENFWEIGKGPGGPNTEIFFDRGEKYDSRTPQELLKDDLENDRVIEIWNIVFSQYNCDPEIPRSAYEELPQKNIDTGMGLERMACISQDVETNFETDNFQIIMEGISKITNTKYEDYKKPYRIIADHIRALTFAIADGVEPSNEGRGYVIRRILRRAVKYAYIELDLQEPFLNELVIKVIEQMKGYYPYLIEKQGFIEQIILREEKQFLKTIKEGFKHLEIYVGELSGDEFPAENAFKLYDTYGFPFELTKEILEEKKLYVNEEEFKKYLDIQKQMARDARKDTSAIEAQNSFLTNIDVPSVFVGYDTLSVDAKVILITNGEEELDELEPGTEGFLIFDKTPFYATSGGQNHDLGGSDSFTILDVIKLPNGQHLHKVKVIKPIKKGDMVHLQVDVENRKATQRNHSGTHLLNHALCKVLGDSVVQAGSYQDGEKTRFDFSYQGEITKEQIREIQKEVNNQIAKIKPTDIQEMDLDKAKESGAKALFDEKYADKVRVVKISDSVELCGGTHVENSNEIEYFFIKNIQSIGSGIYRIEALTGQNVVNYKNEILNEVLEGFVQAQQDITDSKIVKLDELDKKIEILERLNEVIKVPLTKINDQRDNLNILNIRLKNELEKEIQNKINTYVKELSKKVEVFDGVNMIDEDVEGISPKDLKELSDRLLERIGSGIVIVRLIEGDKLSIVIKISDDLTDKYNAGKMVKEILEPLKGRGGGKANMAQGGASLKGIN